MDNTNVVLASNIKKYRKIFGLTQEELAQKLGVTFQGSFQMGNCKNGS